MINKATNTAIKPLLLIATLIFASSLFVTGVEASMRGDTQSTKEPKKESITVTGCLDKGASEDMVVINCQDGTMYILKSKDVDLKAHISHKVTVTGTVTEIDDDIEGSEEYREGGVMMLVVTKLKMISARCQ